MFLTSICNLTLLIVYYYKRIKKFINGFPSVYSSYTGHYMVQYQGRAQDFRRGVAVITDLVGATPTYTLPSLSEFHPVTPLPHRQYIIQHFILEKKE